MYIHKIVIDKLLAFPLIRRQLIAAWWIIQTHTIENQFRYPCIGVSSHKYIMNIYILTVLGYDFAYMLL